ncbi:MAG: class II glutamine amidotransferase, partial [Planctomycetales bacterium]|nr:class II glutamine amidotransferase [Planctomycetales bacterium]
MCGIVGYVGDRPASEFLLEGLRRLEYRGYDSAGIATLTSSGFDVLKTPGRIQGLADLMDDHPLSGSLGIGHTRWATHGPPTTENAHPHVDYTGNVAIVHNGVIENYQSLKQALMAEGYEFKSATDSEVIAQLIS